MSSADGWDLTVPKDAAELLAELRRHGVRPGQRLHVVRVPEEPTQPTEMGPDQPSRRNLDFIGSVDGGPTDLSTRTDEYLRRGFGRDEDRTRAATQALLVDSCGLGVDREGSTGR